MDVIVFAWIVRRVKTDKVSTTRLFAFGQGEFSVDESNNVFAGSTKCFVHVRALEREAHASAVVEVIEEGNQLKRLGLLHNLYPG